MLVIIAYIETSQFKWEGCGTTLQAAEAALHKALREHARRYEIAAPIEWVNTKMSDGFEHRVYVPGQSYIDGEAV